MGTSSSFGGPGDIKPLLPSWALEPVPLPQPPIAVVPDGADSSPPSPPTATQQPAVQPVPIVTVAAPRQPSAPWRGAKRRMGRVASGGGGRAAIGAAARSYVRAKGGARQAARSARGSRAATLAFGGFLTDTVRRGLAEALRRLGNLVLGKDALAAFAAIVDAIAPAGAQPEDASARKGIIEALWELYDKLSLQDGGWEKLESMDAQTVSAALETAVVECVYARWIQEVGIALERKAPTPQAARRREREIKQYVRESVRLDFAGKDVLSIDWSGPDGRKFVESKFVEAYAIFEGL